MGKYTVWVTREIEVTSGTYEYSDDAADFNTETAAREAAALAQQYTNIFGGGIVQISITAPDGSVIDLTEVTGLEFLCV